MSATSPRVGAIPDATHSRADLPARRLSTETKAAFKTTEFIAYLAVLIGIFIAGAVTSGSVDSSGAHHADVLPAHRVWLYATILTIGYMTSRGLAKAGSKQRYDER
jgi:hypothetical protein